MANLKNIRQIGTPAEIGKIYIEDNAYAKIHKEEFADRRVFVLMGHTECEEQGYTTFVEAAIPVWDIGFIQNVPVWNNHVWNETFQVIKKSYENMVIVGWALDIKGVSPRITEELESVHREQFGGVHQLLFLLDSLEQEEYFYICRNNHLRQRPGFYIYFDSGCRPSPQIIQFPQEKVRKEEEAEPVFSEEAVVPIVPRARYREIMGEQKKRKKAASGNWISYYGVFAILVLLGAILGTGIYQGKVDVEFWENAITTMGNSIRQMVLPQ